MRRIAVAVIFFALVAPAAASSIGNPTLFGPAVHKRDAVEISDHRRRASAHKRATVRATQNLFRRYQAASTSRACLTPATRAVLDRLEGRFGRVTIISTCRPGAVIAGTGRPSYHRYGMAVDFAPPRGRKAEVVRFLYAQGVLVMTYTSMSHVHFNLGQGARIACGGCRRKAHHRVAVVPWTPSPAF